ncbi:AAA family ATPase [Escherichia coli]
MKPADLTLSPGFNFLVGANGSGKTSVLEAIYTLGHGRAFRSLQIGCVIRHEAGGICSPWAITGRRARDGDRLNQGKQGDSKVRIDGTDGHKSRGNWRT